MSSDIAYPAITELATPGNPRGTVVLIHGSMDRSDSFRRVTRHLSEWKLVSYDRRGWGKSRPLGGPGTTLADHVADAITILFKLDRSIIVGHSYGGLIALCAVGRRPDLIRAVVAFEPPVRWLPWWPLEAPWERLVRESAVDGPEAAANALHRAVVGHPRIPYSGGQAELAADGAALLTEITDTTLGEPSFDPSTLGPPVVIAAGSDSLPHHRENSRRLAELVPSGRFIEIRGAGHTAHVSHPDKFAELAEYAAMLAEAR